MQHGYPVWSAVYGEYTFSVTTFLEELRDFDARFMVARAEQVAVARQDWPHPDVSIDLELLMREHRERGGWLAEAHARMRRGITTNWSKILAAIEHIERDSTP